MIVVVVAAGVYIWALVNTQREKRENSHAVSVGLTFTGLGALKPPVISFSAPDTSAVIIPSAARSATTSSAGFLERDTFWARHIIARGDVQRSHADRCGD